MNNNTIEYSENPKGTASSFFGTIANPKMHILNAEPMEILIAIKDKWITDEHPKRSCALSYCISENEFEHIHFVFCVDLQNEDSIRFSSIKKLFPTAHIEATKGKRKECLDYINKVDKYAEKNEIVVESLMVGEVFGREKTDTNDSASHKSIMDEIDKLLDANMTPSEIVALGMRYLKYEALIRKAYTIRITRNLGAKKNIKVYWHIGSSGTGKSYSYFKLVDRYPGKVALISDWSNQGTCAFDSYENQPIIFLDELKPSSINFGTLLTVLDERLSSIHARYNNILATWTEVHISSIYSPHQFYDACIYESDRTSEPYRQLQRRINYVVYHKKFTTNNRDYYHAITLTIEEYEKLTRKELEDMINQDYVNKLVKMMKEAYKAFQYTFEDEKVDSLELFHQALMFQDFMFEEADEHQEYMSDMMLYSDDIPQCDLLDYDTYYDYVDSLEQLYQQDTTY